MDLTIRVPGDCDVDVEPDYTVELSWPLGNGARTTILVEPESAKRLSQRLAELVMLIPNGMAYGKPNVDPSSIPEGER